MNIISVFRLLSFIILFVAAIMCIPFSIALHYEESSSANSFIFTIVLMLSISVLIIALTQKKHRTITISVRDSYLFVSLTWVLLSFFGALPLYISDSLPTFPQCYFEIMSGFTTTGATCMNDIESVSYSILFWRNMTNWLGGMGIVVLFVAVLPAFGVKGSNLFGAESVGPTKDKLTPKIRHTAIALWSIYLGLSVIEVVLLLFGGLTLFEATTVTFGTMGAAGFAPKNASIGAFGSDYVEWVCIIFMFLAGANFSLYFKLLRKQFKKVSQDGELRLYFKIILIATLFSAINLYAKGIFTLSDSIRHSAFQVVSFVTTTGFTSTNYSTWPIFSQMILLVLSFVGGCAGSAGGGIKVIRIAVMSKVGNNAIIKRIHPNAVTKIKVGNDTYNEDTVLSICGFVGLYIMTIMIGSFIISATGENLLTCFSSVVLCIGNIGIGLGGIGTDLAFSIYPDWTMWVFSFLMLVGRLELFTVYALFTKSFWTNR